MKIKIKNLTQKMMIGVYDTEKIKPQSVIVNIEIDFYQGDSASTDDINDTLDYGLICKSVKKILLSRHYELIETVVGLVGEYIMSHQSVNTAIVEIDKPEVLIDNVESVSVSKTFIR